MFRVCVAALSGLLAVVAWGGVEEAASKRRPSLMFWTPRPFARRDQIRAQFRELLGEFSE